LTVIFALANISYRRYEARSKLGAEVVELLLGRIIKEVYIKDEGVIIIDPNLYLYKKKAFDHSQLRPPPILQKYEGELFSKRRDNRFNYWKQRRQEREAEAFAASFNPRG
jgi:hypothetical protein